MNDLTGIDFSRLSIIATETSMDGWCVLELCVSVLLVAACVLAVYVLFHS